MLIGFICRCCVLAGKIGDERPSDPFYYLFALYLLPFTVLLLAAKRNWRSIIKYVMLLKTTGGRGSFLVLTGLIFFNAKYKSDVAVSVILTLCGLANLVDAIVIPVIMHFKLFKGDLTEDEGGEEDNKQDNSYLPKNDDN